jgi:hypothetical protein
MPPGIPQSLRKSRGTPLTAVDLIKNLLLAKLDFEGNDSIYYYFKRWQEILANIGDDYSVQERFFRHNYNAFRRSLNRKYAAPTETRPFPLGILATRSNLLDIYEKIITKNPQAFLDELTENAALYAKMIVRDADALSPALRDSYQSLSLVQGTPSYLLLLYLEKMQNLLEVTESDIANIAKLMTTFFVRRNLTDTPPTRDLPRMFMSIIDDLEQNNVRGKNVFSTVKDKLIGTLASDTVFEEKLRGSIYTDN